MDPLDVPLEPTFFPDCCVSLSRQLLDTLDAHLPAHPAQILSIGSGTGLLEHLIVRRFAQKHDITGVEIGPNVNKYLPEQRMTYVMGTWECSPFAASAATWLWIYPRSPSLVSRYLQSYGTGNVRSMIWIGPKADWPAFEIVFGESTTVDREVLEDSGTVEYEMVVLMRIAKT